MCWKLDSSRNVWFFGRELYTAALWPPVLRTCQTAPAPQQPLTLSHQSNISSLYLSPCGGPKVTEACVTVELRGVIDLRREKWLLSTSETATLERGAELWPAGLANADPSYRSNYQLCQIPPSASLLFSLSLSLSLSSSHPPLTLSGLSGAHRSDKTPAPTGEIGQEGVGGRVTRSWTRGEEARVQSIEKLSECERAPGRRVDKIRRGSHLPAELRRGQGIGAFNLVNFRPSILKTRRAELRADKTLWPTCYIKFDFVFSFFLCSPLAIICLSQFLKHSDANPSWSRGDFRSAVIPKSCFLLSTRADWK